MPPFPSPMSGKGEENKVKGCIGKGYKEYNLRP